MAGYKDKIDEAKARMEKTVVSLKKEYSTLRAGRANPQILDKITVDYYGSQTPLSGVANISAPEPRMLVIAPWEAKMIPVIEKAIQKSDLGINPSNDGHVVRLVIPELDAERRKELSKQVKKYADESKVSLRNIRREVMDAFKKMKKDSEITEDDQKAAETQLQKVVDEQTKELDKLAAEKEKEIMSV